LPPINYSKTPVDDPVAKLQRRIDQGKTELEFNEDQGYLASVLEELGVSPTSQMLVFSKTSFQRQRISPRTPRAIYFNDNVYVGWVRNGDVMEFSSVDPKQGAIFYTLKQEAVERPVFVRDRSNCMICHASSRTHDVPGHLVRSVYPSASGLPHFGAGSFQTNHSSPLKERWGGWYVTGMHGAQRHMGNVFAKDRQSAEDLDVESGANVTDLSEKFTTSPYLAPHSDIVALMVLEHQTELHNLITRANYDARLAMYQAKAMNKIMKRPADYISDSTQRRFEYAGDKLLKYLLFTDEVQLTDAIKGTSGFAQQFSAIGPIDRKGRSLRDFDLERRLFKYPCSYLIYSDAFEALPDGVRDHVYRQLWMILNCENKDEAFDHLSDADREAILEILVATKRDLPRYWSSAKSKAMPESR
jgi:hypothetical protein